MRSSALIAISFTLAASEALAAGPKVPTGTPIDETYRKEFAVCDKTNTFDAIKFPIYAFDKKGKPIYVVNKKTGKKRKKVLWYGCSSDPSTFTRFETIAAAGEAPQAVILESKLGHDEDGSAKACGAARGPTDQCRTTLMLNPTPSTPCVIKKKKDGTPLTTNCVPTSADTIPYVVMPAAAPPAQKVPGHAQPVKIDGAKFGSLSNLEVGDYGVVIANGKVIPVVIADTGPAYKIGEGSTALLKRLSSDGKAHTLPSGVIFILFPKTLDPADKISPDTFLSVVNKKGCDLYRKLVADGEAVCH